MRTRFLKCHLIIVFWHRLTLLWHSPMIIFIAETFLELQFQDSLACIKSINASITNKSKVLYSPAHHDYIFVENLHHSNILAHSLCNSNLWPKNFGNFGLPRRLAVVRLLPVCDKVRGSRSVWDAVMLIKLLSRCQARVVSWYLGTEFCSKNS